MGQMAVKRIRLDPAKREHPEGRLHREVRPRPSRLEAEFSLTVERFKEGWLFVEE